MFDKEEEINERQVSFCLNLVEFGNDPFVGGNFLYLMIAQCIGKAQASMEAVANVMKRQVNFFAPIIRF